MGAGQRRRESLPPARRLQKGVVRNPCTQGWGDNAVSKMPAHKHEDLSVSLRHIGGEGTSRVWTGRWLSG